MKNTTLMDAEKWRSLIRDTRKLEGETVFFLEGIAFVIYPASEEDIERIGKGTILEG